MSRYPGANWRGLVPNMAPGGMASHRLFVMHIQEGTESGTDSWVHNPAAQVSANFGNPRAGRPDQWVDTDDRAWAQAAYNDVAISVENEGNSGDSLNANQLENAAQILAWAHLTHGTKLQVTDNPNGEGVIGHSLLGVAGGDHPDCPGAPILAQRQQIVDRAVQIVNGNDMTLDQASIDAVAKESSSLTRNTALGRQDLNGNQIPGQLTSIGVEAAKAQARHEAVMGAVAASKSAADPVAVADALATNPTFLDQVSTMVAHKVLTGLHAALPAT